MGYCGDSGADLCNNLQAIGIVNASPRGKKIPSRIAHAVETLTSYLESLASEAPTPGGGSAAALVAASGAALEAMVARITLGNPKHAAKHDLARNIIERADALRAQCLTARASDERAYERVVLATALPRVNPEEKASRAEALQTAIAQAATAPLETAMLCLQGITLAEQCLELENKHLISDVGCAAEFLASALTAATHNVRINHAYLKNQALIVRQEAELHILRKEADPIIRRLRDALEHELRGL
jgi:formiminotetrahydrofolate cyclodeaminase